MPPAERSISVVIPTYNREGLLRETLDAVLRQTRAANEIIVVDDGSTDGTSAVLAGFDARITIIRVLNGGDLAARNVGLRAATGDLVGFCDDDDLWGPEFLATMSRQWSSELGLLACYCNFRLLQADGLSPRTKFDDAPAGYWVGLRPSDDGGVFDRPFGERLIEFQPFFPSCMMVDRSRFLSLGGWDEGVSRSIGCDFATALLVSMRPPVGVVRTPLVAIRKHAGNLSGRTEAMNLGDANVLEYVLRSRPELAPFRDLVRASIARRREQALNSAFSRRDFGAVLDVAHLIERSRRSWKVRIKAGVSRLPRPVASRVAAALSR